jgi:fluoride ion exporter CrcB/FEX
LVERRGAFSLNTRSFLPIGFLGTFSTFADESWQMGREGEMMRTLAYILASVIGALAAFTAGHAIIRLLER